MSSNPGGEDSKIVQKDTDQEPGDNTDNMEQQQKLEPVLDNGYLDHTPKREHEYVSDVAEFPEELTPTPDENEHDNAEFYRNQNVDLVIENMSLRARLEESLFDRNLTLLEQYGGRVNINDKRAVLKRRARMVRRIKRDNLRDKPWDGNYSSSDDEVQAPDKPWDKRNGEDEDPGVGGSRMVLPPVGGRA